VRTRVDKKSWRFEELLVLFASVERWCDACGLGICFVGEYELGGVEDNLFDYVSAWDDDLDVLC
jgi:hypothetical protein